MEKTSAVQFERVDVLVKIIKGVKIRVRQCTGELRE